MNQAQLDALLDNSISDLADLPEYKVFPAGVHKCTFDFAVKVVGKSPAIVFKFTAVETLELADEENDSPLVAGDECDLANQMDNEFGMGMVKFVCKKACSAMGLDPEITNIRESLEPFKGAEVVIFTGIRLDKKDKNVKYTKLSDIEFDIDSWLAGMDSNAEELEPSHEVKQEVAQTAPATPATPVNPLKTNGLKLGGLKLGAK